MGRFLWLTVFLLMVLAGCGSSHYYRVADNTLDLYLKSPGAEKVWFASSLDGYQPHPAEKRNDSAWRVTVPGNHEFTYFYLVDGAFYLPPCKFKELDDFGAKNCVYIPGT
jgi:hypothetical protein